MIEKLADRAGARMLYLQAHAHTWTDEEWTRRRAMILGDLDALDAALREQSATLEAAGWRVTPNGIWHRANEEPLPPVFPERDELLAQAMQQDTRHEKGDT